MNDDLINRRDAISAFWELNISLRPSAIDAIINMLRTVPSANLQQTCNQLATDCISRSAALDVIRNIRAIAGSYDNEMLLIDKAEAQTELMMLPSAQPEDWMERNKERILQAGMEGREIEFRIGGRLFAIREKAQ